MTEWLVLLVVGGVAAVAIAWPAMRRGPVAATASAPVDETLAVRHRLALEALRDIEADRRAGSLDEAGYAAQRAEAEAHAVATLAALEAGEAPTHVSSHPGVPAAAHRRVLAVVAGALAIGVVAGFALPAPVGLAERTVVNQPLADAIAREEARRAEIQGLLERIAADSRDAGALSALADAYLAGGSRDDLQRAAAALLLLINLEPENASAHRRLATAYISAGDWADARATVDAYAVFAAPDEPDIPFFRGLLALRADQDPVEAVRQFDRFLLLAPDDPRAPMVRGLRTEAAASSTD